MNIWRNLSNILCGALLLTACHSGPVKGQTIYQNQIVKWYPNVSAPRHYEVDLVKGYNYFTLSNGKIVSEFFGDAGAGWGDFRGVASNASGKTPIPIKVNLRWLSLTENQFYEAEFKLPQDEIYQAFKKGYTRRGPNLIGQHDTYSDLSFGFMLGGGVVLWLAGEEIKEIAYFKGKAIDMDWNDFMRGYTFTPRLEWIKRRFDSSPTSVQKQITTKTLPIGLWEFYRKHYPWSISLNGGVLNEYGAAFVNGERYMTFPKDMALVQTQQKPVPNRLELYFTGADGLRRVGIMKFKDDIIVPIYHNFFKHTPDRSGQLVVNVDPITYQAKAALVERNLRSAPIVVDSWKVELAPEGTY